MIYLKRSAIIIDPFFGYDSKKGVIVRNLVEGFYDIVITDSGMELTHSDYIDSNMVITDIHDFKMNDLSEMFGIFDMDYYTELDIKNLREFKLYNYLDDKLKLDDVCEEFQFVVKNDDSIDMKRVEFWRNEKNEIVKIIIY